MPSSSANIINLIEYHRHANEMRALYEKEKKVVENLQLKEKSPENNKNNLLRIHEELAIKIDHLNSLILRLETIIKRKNNRNKISIGYDLSKKDHAEIPLSKDDVESNTQENLKEKVSNSKDFVLDILNIITDVIRVENKEVIDFSTLFAAIATLWDMYQASLHHTIGKTARLIIDIIKFLVFAAINIITYFLETTLLNALIYTSLVTITIFLDVLKNIFLSFEYKAKINLETTEKYTTQKIINANNIYDAETYEATQKFVNCYNNYYDTKIDKYNDNLFYANRDVFFNTIALLGAILLPFSGSLTYGIYIMAFSTACEFIDRRIEWVGVTSCVMTQWLKNVPKQVKDKIQQVHKERDHLPTARALSLH